MHRRNVLVFKCDMLFFKKIANSINVLWPVITAILIHNLFYSFVIRESSWLLFVKIESGILHESAVNNGVIKNCWKYLKKYCFSFIYFGHLAVFKILMINDIFFMLDNFLMKLLSSFFNLYINNINFTKNLREIQNILTFNLPLNFPINILVTLH